jgi:hypothetical protein
MKGCKYNDGDFAFVSLFRIKGEGLGGRSALEPSLDGLKYVKALTNVCMGRYLYRNFIQQQLWVF